MCHIERCIGRGASGVVYLLQTETLDQYALKVTWLRQQTRKDPDKEAKLLEKLCHPHLTQCCAHFMDNGALYLLTEFCRQGSLKNYLQKRHQKQRHIEEILILKWTNQMADALKYLHDKKIIHRDLKTDNVFLQDEDNIKIGDLGIARELAFTNEELNSFVGTLPYMSPEILDCQPYDSKSDMWSLGCCIHEMVTLQPTFPSSFFELADKIKQGDIPPFPPIYTKELNYIVLLLLKPEPSQRPDALAVQFYITQITKKRFKTAPHIPLPALDVTNLKSKIIELVANYPTSTPDPEDSTTVQPGSSQSSTFGMMNYIGLAEEAREWLRTHSTKAHPEMKDQEQNESRHSSGSIVTLYTRAQCAKYEHKKRVPRSESLSELPTEMKEAAYNVIQLYQHEDQRFTDMMLVSVLGQRNFHIHRDALMEEYKKNSHL